MKEQLLKEIEKLMNELALDLWKGSGVPVSVIERYFKKEHPCVIWHWQDDAIVVDNYIQTEI